MKKQILRVSIAMIALAGLSTIAGCKKGDNDPFLSLKSRTARITGEWELEGGTITTSSTSGGTTESDVTTYTGSSVSQDGSTVSYSETLTIEKDGTFEVVIVEDGETSIVRGNWYFAGKNKEIDLKKKEAIIFSETEYVNPGGSSVYTGVYADQAMLIDQLKNKEIVFKGSYKYFDSDGYGASYSYNRTFEKK